MSYSKYKPGMFLTITKKEVMSDMWFANDSD
jgi:hypothetical protein